MKKLRLTFCIMLLTAILAAMYFQPIKCGEIIYKGARELDLKRAGLNDYNVMVDGLRWHYLIRDERNAKQCIVLIHGITAEADNWLRFAVALPKDICLIVPDLVGFGRSQEINNIDYTIPAQTKRLKHFLDKVAPNISYHLVGNSGGGHLVTLYTLDYPEEVASLALINATGVIVAEKSDAKYFVENTGHLVDDIKSIKDYELSLSFVFNKTPFIPEVVKSYLANKRIMHNKYYLSILKETRFKKYYIDNRLSEIKTPTILIWGMQDRYFEPSIASVFHHGIAGSELIQVPGAGHVPMLESPEFTADAYHKFIKKWAIK